GTARRLRQRLQASRAAFGDRLQCMLVLERVVVGGGMFAVEDAVQRLAKQDGHRQLGQVGLVVGDVARIEACVAGARGQAQLCAAAHDALAEGEREARFEYPAGRALGPPCRLLCKRAAARIAQVDDHVDQLQLLAGEAAQRPCDIVGRMRLLQRVVQRREPACRVCQEGGSDCVHRDGSGCLLAPWCCDAALKSNGRAGAGHRRRPAGWTADAAGCDVPRPVCRTADSAQTRKGAGCPAPSLSRTDGTQRFIEAKNSSLDLVLFILSSRNSIAAISSIGCSSLRRIQMRWSRSGSIRKSSRRVPERLTAIAGYTRFSAMRRSRWISELPVPLNSS